MLFVVFLFFCVSYEYLFLAAITFVVLYIFTDLILAVVISAPFERQNVEVHIFDRANILVFAT